MSNTPLVPEPPSEKIVVPEEDEIRLSEWISFFKGLSSRIKVVLPDNEGFEEFIQETERILRREKHLESDYRLIGFPTQRSTAFAILINSAGPHSTDECCDCSGVFFFCFDDIAFSLNHFHWDGDAENGNFEKSFSLNFYTADLLKWSFIKDLIIGRLKDLQNRVPPLK